MLPVGQALDKAKRRTVLLHGAMLFPLGDEPVKSQILAKPKTAISDVTPTWPEGFPPLRERQLEPNKRPH